MRRGGNRGSSSRARFAIAGCAILAIASSPRLAEAQPRPKKAAVHAKYRDDGADLPAGRYFSLSPDACTRELTARGISFERVAHAPGVVSPMRFPDGIGGVLYRTGLPAHARRESPYDVMDCRLALALSDLSKILVANDVDEVVMFSAWRPSKEPDAHDSETDASFRHAGALAMDLEKVRRKDASWVSVEGAFAGAHGKDPCAPLGSATKADTRLLRQLVCRAAETHLFSSILTPNYDRAHRNHVHLELAPDVGWFLIR